jgi:hypothetical protein
MIPKWPRVNGSLLPESTNATRHQLLDIELLMEQQMMAFNATFGRLNFHCLEPIVTICLKTMETSGIMHSPGRYARAHA